MTWDLGNTFRTVSSISGLSSELKLEWEAQQHADKGFNLCKRLGRTQHASTHPRHLSWLLPMQTRRVWHWLRVKMGSGNLVLPHSVNHPSSHRFDKRRILGSSLVNRHKLPGVPLAYRLLNYLIRWVTIFSNQSRLFIEAETSFNFSPLESS